MPSQRITVAPIANRILTLAVALLCAMAASRASAQEVPTRNQFAGLQAFGLFSYVQPHYGAASNPGGTLGADLNFRPLYFLQPSLDMRYTFAPGADVTENTLGFGPRVELTFSRLHPYLYALVGHGTITFANPISTPTGPYTHDDSLVLGGGFGADYMLTRQLGLRAEVTQQRWNLGNGPTSVIFHPRIYSVGVDYRFDFNKVSRHRP